MAGANKLALGKRGELIVQTGNGPVTYTAPIAYQEDASSKSSEIKVAYALNTSAHSYGFTVGDYNPGQALVIDPLLQSTYLGSAGDGYATALAIHPVSGDVYVTGKTVSTTFPGAGGGAQSSHAAGGAVAAINAGRVSVFCVTRQACEAHEPFFVSVWRHGLAGYGAENRA